MQKYIRSTTWQNMVFIFFVVRGRNATKKEAESDFRVPAEAYRCLNCRFDQIFKFSIFFFCTFRNGIMYLVTCPNCFSIRSRENVVFSAVLFAFASVEHVPQ